MRTIYFEKSLGIDIRENSVCLALLGKTWRSTEVLACHFFEIEPLSEGKKTIQAAILCGLLSAETLVFSGSKMPGMAGITLWLFFYYHSVEH